MIAIIIENKEASKLIDSINQNNQIARPDQDSQAQNQLLQEQELLLLLLASFQLLLQTKFQHGILLILEAVDVDCTDDGVMLPALKFELFREQQ